MAALPTMNPLKQVSNLLSQFTGLQLKLEKAIEVIRARRDARRAAIQSLEAEVAECDRVQEQAENAVRGIVKLLNGE